MTSVLDRIASPPPLVPPSFLLGTALGASIFTIFFRLSPFLTSRLATPSFVRNVSNLDDAARYNYHSYLPSTIHAILQVVGTSSFVFFHHGDADADDDATSFDSRTLVPYGVTRLGPCVYMGIFVGYLLSDLFAAPSLKAMGYPFVAHHVAASACWAYCACHGVMQRVGCMFQFNEVSTPLMNLRQYLLTAGYGSGEPIVAMTSLAFFAIFGLARVVPLPFVTRDWATRDYFAIRDKVGTRGAVLLTAFFAVNAALQCGWFYSMCRMVAKMMTAGGTKKEKRPRRKVGEEEEEEEEEKKKAR
jgi:hypothetical protein